MSNNQNYYGGTDPAIGAKRHKQVVESVNKEPEMPAQDITQTDMFKKLFGAETAREFQKMEAKKQLEKPIVRDLGTKNKEAHNESENRFSDSKKGN